MTQAPTNTTAPPDAAKAQDPTTALAAAFNYQPLMKIGGHAGLKGLLAAMQPKIATVLPKHITPERVIKAALTAVLQTPKLLNCTQESFMMALIRASQLGLDCSGTLGSGYLVPYYNRAKQCTECQFIPGYRGLIDLARRSNEIAAIEAHAVYVDDVFEVQYGTEPRLIHKPSLKTDRREEFICFYAVGTLRDGTKQLEMMTLADVKKIQSMSKMGNRGPWVDHFSEMGRKTAVRRLCKYLPMSTELEKALQHDNEVEGLDVREIDVEALDNINRTEDLAKRLAGEQDQPPAQLAAPQVPDPTPPAPEPAVQPPTPEQPAKAAPADAGEVEVHFKELLESKGAPAEVLPEAWQRFVRFTVGKELAELNAADVDTLAAKLKSDFNPMGYIPAKNGTQAAQ